MSPADGASPRQLSRKGIKIYNTLHFTPFWPKKQDFRRSGGGKSGEKLCPGIAGGFVQNNFKKLAGTLVKPEEKDYNIPILDFQANFPPK